MDARRHGLVDKGHPPVVENDRGVGDVATGVVENRLDQQAAFPEDDGAVVHGGVVGRGGQGLGRRSGLLGAGRQKQDAQQGEQDQTFHWILA